MIEDEEAEELTEGGGSAARRVAFQIVPSSLVRPQPSTSWQSLFAGTLLLFTLGSCMQLGLAANVHLLPKVRAEERLASREWSDAFLVWQHLSE